MYYSRFHWRAAWPKFTSVVVTEKKHRTQNVYFPIATTTNSNNDDKAILRDERQRGRETSAEVYGPRICYTFIAIGETKHGAPQCVMSYLLPLWCTIAINMNIRSQKQQHYFAFGASIARFLQYRSFYETHNLRSFMRDLTDFIKTASDVDVSIPSLSISFHITAPRYRMLNFDNSLFTTGIWK